MTQFILMLTHQDLTLPDSLEILDDIGQTGVRFIGFKDVGVPESKLVELTAAIKGYGAYPVLEVVSLTEQDELASAETGVRLGVDYLIGGTRIDLVQRVIEGTGIKYFPYVGDVMGHPAKLGGAPEDIVAEALTAQSRGVDGINLLAYRYTGDGLSLAAEVNSALDIPLICAGGVDSLERVRQLAEIGVWALTIGGAVVTRSIAPGADIPGQVAAVLECLDDSKDQLKGAT